MKDSTKQYLEGKRNPQVKPFSVADWLNQPESVLDLHGNRYWVNLMPATGD